MSDYERKHWVEAMGGTWPAVNTLQRIRADSVEENLNSLAFTFLKDCLAELEARDLNDQGLYRVGGVVSKVKRLLNEGLDPQLYNESEPIDLSDPKQWESKTIASAVKQYFRDLSKPLMTHQLYSGFLEAVKAEEEEQRLREIQMVMQKLPVANREILKVLIRHLSKVAAKSGVNLMTASNIGVCFGPTLLRPKVETVASIMDIKFCNEVIEILIENCDRFFPNLADSSPEMRKSMDESRSRRGSSTPMRTHSFSSFSQMSTNSLPDIKEFKAPTGSSASSSKHTSKAATNNSSSNLGSRSVDVTDGVPSGGFGGRPRSKSHQHDSPSVFPQQVSKSSVGNINSNGYGPGCFVGKQSSLPPLSPIHHIHHPPPLLKSQTQDDLMASLEMMNNLAADLPSSTSPLRRSQTLQPGNRGIQRRNTASEVMKKPPLPKLTIPESEIHLSKNAAGPVNGGANGHPTPFTRQHSSPSPSISTSSADSATASPRIVRQPSQQHSSHLVIDEKNELVLNPPSVPTRKYKRIFVSPVALQEHANKIAEVSLSRRHRQDQQDSEQLKVTSHSPPTMDSGVTVSPQTQPRRAGQRNGSEGIHSDDAVSITSSALSVESDTSGSKYDNVAGASNLHGQSNPQTKDEDGDDEDEEDSSASSATSSVSSESLLSDNVILDSSGTEHDGGTVKERGVNGREGEDKFQSVVFRREDRILNRLRSRNREVRDSGPYENVNPEQHPHNVSLKNMMSTGQTSNV